MSKEEEIVRFLSSKDSYAIPFDLSVVPQEDADFTKDFKYAKDHIPKAEEKGVKDIMKMGGHESSKEIFETIEERISESLKSNPSELPQASAVSAVTAMTGEVKMLNHHEMGFLNTRDIEAVPKDLKDYPKLPSMVGTMIGTELSGVVEEQGAVNLNPVDIDVVIPSKKKKAKASSSLEDTNEEEEEGEEKEEDEGGDENEEEGEDEPDPEEFVFTKDHFTKVKGEDVVIKSIAMFPNDWNIGEFRGRLDDMLAADNIIRVIGDPTHDVKVAEQANNLAVGAENEEEEEPKIVYERRKVPMIDVTEDDLSGNNKGALDIFYFQTTAVQFRKSQQANMGGDLKEFRKFDFATPAKDDKEKGKKEMMSSRATTKATIRDWEPYLGKDANTLNRLYDFHKILAQYVDAPHKSSKFVEGERLFDDMLNHNGMKPGKVFGRLEGMSYPATTEEDKMQFASVLAESDNHRNLGIMVDIVLGEVMSSEAASSFDETQITKIFLLCIGYGARDTLRRHFESNKKRCVVVNEQLSTLVNQDYSLLIDRFSDGLDADMKLILRRLMIFKNEYPRIEQVKREKGVTKRVQGVMEDGTIIVYQDKLCEENIEAMQAAIAIEKQNGRFNLINEMITLIFAILGNTQSLRLLQKCVNVEKGDAVSFRMYADPLFYVPSLLINGPISWRVNNALDMIKLLTSLVEMKKPPSISEAVELLADAAVMEGDEPTFGCEVGMVYSALISSKFITSSRFLPAKATSDQVQFITGKGVDKKSEGVEHIEIASAFMLKNLGNMYVDVGMTSVFKVLDAADFVPKYTKERLRDRVSGMSDEDVVVNDGIGTVVNENSRIWSGVEATKEAINFCARREFGAFRAILRRTQPITETEENLITLPVIKKVKREEADVTSAKEKRKQEEGDLPAKKKKREDEPSGSRKRRIREEESEEEEEEDKKVIVENQGANKRQKASDLVTIMDISQLAQHLTDLKNIHWDIRRKYQNDEGDKVEFLVGKIAELESNMKKIGTLVSRLRYTIQFWESVLKKKHFNAFKTPVYYRRYAGLVNANMGLMMMRGVLALIMETRNEIYDAVSGSRRFYSSYLAEEHIESLEILGTVLSMSKEDLVERDKILSISWMKELIDPLVLDEEDRLVEKMMVDEAWKVNDTESLENQDTILSGAFKNVPLRINEEVDKSPTVIDGMRKRIARYLAMIAYVSGAEGSIDGVKTLFKYFAGQKKTFHLEREIMVSLLATYFTGSVIKSGKEETGFDYPITNKTLGLDFTFQFTTTDKKTKFLHPSVQNEIRKMPVFLIYINSEFTAIQSAAVIQLYSLLKSRNMLGVKNNIKGITDDKVIDKKGGHLLMSAFVQMFVQKFVDRVHDTSTKKFFVEARRATEALGYLVSEGFEVEEDYREIFLEEAGLVSLYQKETVFRMLAILGKLKLKITTPEREEGEEKVTYLKEKIAAIQDSLRKQLMVAVLSTELYLCDRDAAQISKLNVGYLFDSSRDVTEIRAPLRSLGNRFGIRKDAILLLEEIYSISKTNSVQGTLLDALRYIVSRVSFPVIISEDVDGLQKAAVIRTVLGYTYSEAMQEVEAAILLLKRVRKEFSEALPKVDKGRQYLFLLEEKGIAKGLWEKIVKGDKDENDRAKAAKLQDIVDLFMGDARERFLASELGIKDNMVPTEENLFVWSDPVKMKEFFAALKSYAYLPYIADLYLQGLVTKAFGSAETVESFIRPQVSTDARVMDYNIVENILKEKSAPPLVFYLSEIYSCLKEKDIHIPPNWNPIVGRDSGLIHVPDFDGDFKEVNRLSGEHLEDIWKSASNSNPLAIKAGEKRRWIFSKSFGFSGIGVPTRVMTAIEVIRALSLIEGANVAPPDDKDRTKDIQTSYDDRMKTTEWASVGAKYAASNDRKNKLFTTEIEAGKWYFKKMKSEISDTNARKEKAAAKKQEKLQKLVTEE